MAGEVLLLPSLLSRLTSTGSSDNASEAIQILREEIKTNIALLLNSRSRPERSDLRNDPYLFYSVLGMGLSDVCGLSHSSRQIEALKQAIYEQITHFEPRLDPRTVQVKLGREDKQSHGELELTISATINLPEYRDDLKISFTLDLETGVVSF